jgi:hypothetical protein
MPTPPTRNCQPRWTCRCSSSNGNDGPLYRLQTRAVGDETEAARLLYQLQDRGFAGAKIRRVRVQQVALKIAG